MLDVRARPTPSPVQTGSGENGVLLWCFAHEKGRFHTSRICELRGRFWGHLPGRQEKKTCRIGAKSAVFWRFWAVSLMFCRSAGAPGQASEKREESWRNRAFLGRFADVLPVSRGTWPGSEKTCRIRAKSAVFGRFWAVFVNFFSEHGSLARAIGAAASRILVVPCGQKRVFRGHGHPKTRFRAIPSRSGAVGNP